MSIKSGFFNSVNGDRKYDADDFTSLIATMVTDGVCANVGDVFTVKSTGDLNISVGAGRAWFNNAWIYNDSATIFTLSAANTISPRYDAVIIEVDRSSSVRNGTIKIINGVASSTPAKPTMIKRDTCVQYPLAYIYRAAASTAVTQGNIINCIGTSECPYVTSLLETHNVDNLVAQWQSQFNEWYRDIQSESQAWMNNIQLMLAANDAAKLASNIDVLNRRIDTIADSRAVGSSVYDSEGNIVYDNADGQLLGGISLATKEEVVTKDKIANNLSTTQEGFILDARQGKVLNDALGALHNEFYMLVNYQQVPTSKTNYTLYNGRKISDYDLIIMAVLDNSVVRNPMIVPSGILSGNAKQYEIDYNTTTVSRWCSFTYVNDTTVTIYGASNNTAYALMWGIKLTR